MSNELRAMLSEVVEPLLPWAREFEGKSISAFRSAVRGSVRGLWSGNTDTFGFVNSMVSAIDVHLIVAWHEGAAQCGIAPDEMTPEERGALTAAVNENTAHLTGFADAVAEGSKENGGKLGDLWDRAELWVNRYGNVVSKAQSIVCADKKFMWLRGATEKGCRSCIGLDGRVYRGSVWAANNAEAQGRNLECGGHKCLCQLVPTDSPITQGRFPRGLLN